MGGAHDDDLALGEERGAGQLGQGAGLELVGGEVAHIGVRIRRPGSRHHLLHRTIQQQVFLAHRDRDGGERVVLSCLPGHRVQHPTPH